MQLLPVDGEESNAAIFADRIMPFELWMSVYHGLVCFGQAALQVVFGLGLKFMEAVDPHSNALRVVVGIRAASLLLSKDFLKPVSMVGQIKEELQSVYPRGQHGLFIAMEPLSHAAVNGCGAYLLGHF